MKEMAAQSNEWLVVHTDAGSVFSFPIGHTGTRYRVGAFYDEPVRRQSLARLDSGSFVLTKQRVAYVGRTKSTSVALSKVLHVEVFNDGLSIAREGKDTSPSISWPIRSTLYSC
jgi:hypothetical protein